jgi:hypothetical protein
VLLCPSIFSQAARFSVLIERLLDDAKCQCGVHAYVLTIRISMQIVDRRKCLDSSGQGAAF